VTLSKGANTVTVVVTAEDGVSTQTYTVTVNATTSTPTLTGKPIPHYATSAALEAVASTYFTKLSTSTLKFYTANESSSNVTDLSTQNNYYVSQTLSGIESERLLFTFAIASELYADGISVSSFSDFVGYTAHDIIKAGYSYDQLTAAGYSLIIGDGTPHSANFAENAATSTIVYTPAATVAYTPVTNYNDTSAIITYSIVDGSDSAYFNINSTSGAITFKVSPNYEVKNMYTFTVRAEDLPLYTTQSVTINVTDVNEGPVFDFPTSNVVPENISTSYVVYTAHAVDPEGGSTAITYSIVSGSDARADGQKFNINASSGAVTFKTIIPNYEQPSDFNTNNSYEITIKATDSNGFYSTQNVTITVANLNEAPTLLCNDCTNGGSTNAKVLLFYGIADPTTTVTLYYVNAGGTKTASTFTGTADNRGNYHIYVRGLSIGTYTFIATARLNNGSPEPLDSAEYTITTTVNSIGCFLAKTPVLTNHGYVNIEAINPEIHTVNNHKIVAITRTSSQEKHMVCVAKNALGENYPSRDTYMSLKHKIFYQGRMIQANKLVHLEGVSLRPYKGEVFYNVLLENYEQMKVNNMVVETLHPKNAVAVLYNTLMNTDINLHADIIEKHNVVEFRKQVRLRM